MTPTCFLKAFNLGMLKIAWNHLLEAYFVQKRRFGQKSGNMDICKYRKMVIQEFV